LNTEWILFLLRVASAAALLILLGALFFVIWKDYQSTVSRIYANQRSYGRLVTLEEIDGSYVALGEIHALLSLTTLGRSPTNTIVINDSFASGEHARITLRNGQWWLEDRNSRNGTTLNEIPISQSVVMTNGDIIGIGHKRYRLDLE
jgi:hypothetical protein